jgi:hypothetical protein
MQRQGEETHFETDEARGASSPNIVRWVLGISLFAAIALLSVIWISGAATRVEGRSAEEARERTLQEYGSQGGVLAGSADEIDAAEPGETAAPGAPPTVENEAADAPAPSPEPAAS